MLFKNTLCTNILTYKYMTELMLHVRVKPTHNDDPQLCTGVHIYTHFRFWQISVILLLCKVLHLQEVKIPLYLEMTASIKK